MKRETRILGYLAAAAAGAFFLLRKKRPTPAVVVVDEGTEEEVADPEKEPGFHGSYRKWFYSYRERQIGEFAAWGVWVADIQAPAPNPFLYLPTESIPEEWFVDNAATKEEAKQIMKAYVEALPVRLKEDLQP